MNRTRRVRTHVHVLPVLSTLFLVAAAPAGGSAPAPLASVGAAVAASPAPALAEAALEAFTPVVAKTSHPEALRTAFEAYFSYREARPDRVTKPYLYFVDLGLDNRTARGYVFDMDALTLVEGPFHVAHGSGSSRLRDAVPTIFSNRAGSNASSLGLYLAAETYTFHGKSNGRPYSSTGLRMDGESTGYNDAARARGVVAHGAPYVTSTGAGRSQGCPAMEMARAERLLPMISNGGVVFVYSPLAERWLDDDPWVNAP